MNKVEWYDIDKNVWNNLPDTNKAHDMNPLIWIENNDLFHIMSISGNCVECIDLRDGKEWKLKIDDISKLFHTKFAATNNILDITASRLVGNK